jgi:hypothetical protein
VSLLLRTASGRARVISEGLRWSPGTATPPVPVRPGPWLFFTADGAALVEAAVDGLIPPDDRGPGGKDVEVGNQVLISSHRKLLSSKAMVVNVAEKSEQDFDRHD